MGSAAAATGGRPSLRGVLSIIEAEGQGEYGSPGLPADLEPYTANMVVHVLSLLAAGGFPSGAGRYGDRAAVGRGRAARLALAGSRDSVRYDSRIVVHHQIQAAPPDPGLAAVAAVLAGRLHRADPPIAARPDAVWRELPRRVAVAALCAPAGLMPRRSTLLIGARWRLAYAPASSGRRLAGTLTRPRSMRRRLRCSRTRLPTPQASGVEEELVCQTHRAWNLSLRGAERRSNLLPDERTSARQAGDCCGAARLAMTTGWLGFPLTVKTF